MRRTQQRPRWKLEGQRLTERSQKERDSGTPQPSAEVQESAREDRNE
jgi:hypothetical protein